jgi:hypothetical protein
MTRRLSKWCVSSVFQSILPIVDSALGDFPYDITIGGSLEQEVGAGTVNHPSGGVLVPAEVSKRGVMISFLREPSPAGEREPVSL